MVMALSLHVQRRSTARKAVLNQILQPGWQVRRYEVHYSERHQWSNPSQDPFKDPFHLSLKPYFNLQRELTTQVGGQRLLMSHINVDE